MQVHCGVASLPRPLAKSVVTLGNFDGLHLGHQQLISRLKELAQKYRAPTVLMTFDPHPQQILQPGKPFHRLYSTARTLELLEGFGIEEIVVEPFTAEFSQLSPQAFFERFLIRPLAPQALVVGHDFSFGVQRSGHQAELKRLAESFSVQLLVESEVSYEGERVASSGIRAHLQKGEIARANRLLGRPYDLSGVVVQGEQRGRLLGVPTANLPDCDYTYLRPGVYVTRSSINGQNLNSVTNVGHNPTFTPAENKIKIETHFLDEKGDVYGELLRVEFLDFIRPELKFSSVDELKNAMLADINHCKRYFEVMA